ncbi:MAG: mandelate racemase/muconate lactonizing enzyme family protein, partial [Chloroflexia bacterium]|nr:mandelate racemase/muconate lactonizing enzyme family protein [Chloroflexia bacterium]
NNAWTPAVTLRFMRQVADQDIFWLEEPVPTDDVAGSAELARALDVPVAGYESETGLGGFRDLIERQAVDIVQPDVIWTGGITECKRVAAVAHAHRLPVIPHVFSSAVAAIANMHFIAAIPNGGLLEFDQNPNPLRSDLFEEPIEVGPDGKVRLPERPGLGVALNQATVDKYRVETDPTPALLTRMSSPPNAATVCSTIAWTCVWSRTSTATANASPCSPTISSTTVCAASAFMSATATRAPSSA